MWNSQSYFRKYCTLEDWTKLQEKVIKFVIYGFLVDPVILKLIETYKGEADEEFWVTIASKVFYSSGGPGNINGW